MECTKIEWAENYDFAPRAKGEPADFTDKLLKVYYDDGSVSVMEIAVNMINDSDLQSTNPERRVVIRYNGKKLPVTLQVLPISLSGIEAMLLVPPTFTEGEALNKSLLCVTALYDDGSRREVQNYKFFPYKPFSLTDSNITIKYGRFSVNIPVTVISANIGEEDEPDEPGEVLDAEAEEDDDLLGGPVPERMKEQGESPVLEEELVDEEDNIQASTTAPETSEEQPGRTEERVVPDIFESKVDMNEVTEAVTQETPQPQRELLGIYISKQPKTSYVEGDLFDASSLEIKAVYSDEFEEVVSAKIVPDGPLSAGTGHVIASYEGKSAIILITVAERQIIAPEPPEPFQDEPGQDLGAETEQGASPAREPQEAPESVTEPVSEEMKEQTPAQSENQAAEPVSEKVEEQAPEQDVMPEKAEEEAAPTPEPVSEKVKEEKRAEPPTPTVPPIHKQVSPPIPNWGSSADWSEHSEENIPVLVPMPEESEEVCKDFYPSTFSLRFSEDMSRYL